MNITFCLTSYYEQKPPLRQSENKPNSKPIKPNLKNVKMNVNSVKTNDYRNYPRLCPPAKQTQFQTQTNPISNLENFTKLWHINAINN